MVFYAGEYRFHVKELVPEGGPVNGRQLYWAVTTKVYAGGSTGMYITLGPHSVWQLVCPD